MIGLLDEHILLLSAIALGLLGVAYAFLIRHYLRSRYDEKRHLFRMRLTLALAAFALAVYVADRLT